VNGNIADFLIRSLAAAGEQHIYGIVGDCSNGVAEALRLRRRSVAPFWAPFETGSGDDW